jgi:hypothetical protein
MSGAWSGNFRSGGRPGSESLSRGVLHTYAMSLAEKYGLDVQTLFEEAEAAVREGFRRGMA